MLRVPQPCFPADPVCVFISLIYQRMPANNAMSIWTYSQRQNVLTLELELDVDLAQSSHYNLAPTYLRRCDFTWWSRRGNQRLLVLADFNEESRLDFGMLYPRSFAFRSATNSTSVSSISLLRASLIFRRTVHPWANKVLCSSRSKVSCRLNQ